ncbi:hypothetical protein [Herbidospora yilanensis]|uniref:hypothetical protein n=1 Tax=Herbidospora yilanensis TaxID=354426 RepID=UPI0012F8D7FD|nr:hypothetical protein [Herbidospora yilanensis]
MTIVPEIARETGEQMANDEPLHLDLNSLDVTTVELPGEDLVEALGMGLGNTEVGASGIGRTSWLI